MNNLNSVSVSSTALVLQFKLLSPLFMVIFILGPWALQTNPSITSGNLTSKQMQFHPSQLVNSSPFIVTLIYYEDKPCLVK